MKVIQKVEIKNFLGTEYRYIDFSEKNDSVLIVGENAKGKTTIMRAIYFALTGEDAFFGSTNLDSVIKDNTDETNINVELLNPGNSKMYYIEISKKRGKSLKIKIYENGVLLNTSDLITEAKEILALLFGNPLSIKNTYFMFSSSDDDFVNATNSRRLEIITKTSNIFEEYEMISDSAKNMVMIKNDEKIKLQGELENENLRITENENLIKEIEEKIKTPLEGDFSENGFNKFSKKIDDKQNILLKIIERIDEKEKIEAEILNIQSVDLDELKKKIDEDDRNIEYNTVINNKINQLRIDIASLMKEKENLIKELSLKKEKIANIKGVINSLKTQIIPIEDSDYEFEYKEKKDFSVIENEIKIKKQELEELKSYGIKINTNIEAKKLEIEKTKEVFNHNKECPICHSKLTEEALILYIKTKEKEINELETERNILRDKYKQKNDECLLMEKIYNINLKIEQNKKIQSDIFQYEKELSNIEIANIEQEINDYSNKINDLEKNIISFEKEKKETLSVNEKNDIKNKIENIKNINLKKKRLDELNAVINNLGYNNKTKNEVNNELEEVKVFGNNIKFMFGQYLSLKKAIFDGKNKLLEIQQKIDRIKKDIEQYDYLRNIFGKNGIQKEQIEHILKSVEIETNAMINKFFDNIGVKFVYDGNGIGLEIIRQVISDMGIEYKRDVLKNFSDAQQEVLRILLKLSFSKVLQYLNSVPLNIIFLNETFNTLSVDKEEDLVNILEYFSKEYQVFFITHNQSLISKYDNESIIKLV